MIGKSVAGMTPTDEADRPQPRPGCSRILGLGVDAHPLGSRLPPSRDRDGIRTGHAALQRKDIQALRSHGSSRTTGKVVMMEIKFAALTIVALAMTPLAALAQSAPAPINQTGPGVSAPVSTSTDMGIAGQSGDTWSVPGGPRAAVVAPGYGSYAAVPSAGYYGAPAYCSERANGW